MSSRPMELASTERVFGVSAVHGRWTFIILGLLTNLCLGSVYSFSVFKAPLIERWGISATASSLPFMIALAFFNQSLVVSGTVKDPKVASSNGYLFSVLPKANGQ